MAYGIFRKVTTLEFFQHHFAKSGHGDGLLMTRQFISTARQPPLHYLTRSVCRTSGFVLADNTARCRRLPRTSRSLCPPHLRTHGLVTKGLIDCSNGVLVRGGLMETSAPAQSASGRYPRVASPIHTILVLAAIGGWAIGHRIFADQLSATANPNRVRFYVVTVLYEWLLFVLVVVGVRRSGASVITVLGEHWNSVRQV